MPKIRLLIPLLLLFFGCQPSGDMADEVVARVYDEYLTREELADRLPPVFEPTDSAKLARDAIEQWISTTALVNIASRNLPEELMDFDEQIENYRQSLIIYAYESELIRQKLDTIISDSEVEEYYHAHIQNFLLTDYIVKVRYVKLNENAPEQEEFEKLFTAEDEDKVGELFRYCQQYAENYFLEEDSWLYLKDLLKEIPLNPVDLEVFLKENTELRFEERDYTYYLKIYDYKLIDDISPLSLERETIKNLILNKRKVDLINKMRSDIVNDGLNEKHIEIY